MVRLWLYFGLVAALLAGAGYIQSTIKQNGALRADNEVLHDKLSALAEQAKQLRQQETQIAKLTARRNTDAAATEQWLREYSARVPTDTAIPPNPADCRVTDPVRAAEVVRACSEGDAELRLLKDALKVQFP